MYCTPSTTTNMNMRLRTGSDDTDATYHIQFFDISSSSVTASNSISQAQWKLQSANQDSPNGYNMTIFNPNKAENTVAFLGTIRHLALSYPGFSKLTSVQYTGLTIFPASGTITGSISVFGVNK